MIIETTKTLHISIVLMIQAQYIDTLLIESYLWYGIMISLKVGFSFELLINYLISTYLYI